MSTAPRASYRLQLHAGFTFDDACAQVPYLAALGISHAYTSPILAARAGSTHGYNGVDPTRVNPELGGEDGLRRFVERLRACGMGLIVDIVPNHLAVGGSDNPWWLDVLEWGRESPFASFFDIDWDVPDPALAQRVHLPFLGKPYGEALVGGDIGLHHDADAGRFYFLAHDTHRVGLAPALYAAVLRAAPGEMLSATARRFREALIGRRGRAHRRAAFETACAEFAQALVVPAAQAAMQELLAQYAPDSAEGRERLHRLLERQHVRLAWWRTASDEINWRRFFDVTELAGLRMDEPAAFEAVHATLLRLYAEGIIDGLRVDHVDGLADPRAYCRKLRARLDTLSPQRPAHLPRGPAYLVVEKILAPDEQLARSWRTDGTSGYVFMNQVGALLHEAGGREALAALWRECSGSEADFEQEERAARRRIPQQLFAADFAACARALHRIARLRPVTRDWTLDAIRRCLTEMLVHFPVYRTYADARGRSAADSQIMRGVIERAAQTCRPGERALLTQIDLWLGGEPAQDVRDATERRERLRALARFQQLTSPVAAKSVEDTAFYRFGVLVSRNEVGANPGDFALSTAGFHRACGERARRYPDAMLATATHDHKRGEDLRARLAVLSEIPRDWAQAVHGWRRLNAALKPAAEGEAAPDATDEYVLYQMLVGAWPLELSPKDACGLQALRERLGQWQCKAVREAKRRSGWIEPNLAYENACDEFLARLLDPVRSAAFLRELAAFAMRIAAPGALNGLVQTLLRLSTPGVPDLYQGSESWDFSLVDPDNRRPVDYATRTAALHSRAADEALLRNWTSGAIKQRLIARTLALRAQCAELFARGSYQPLRARGARAAQVLAFARGLGSAQLLVIVPLHTALMARSGAALAPDPRGWGNTRVELPLSGRWTDVLNEDTPAPGFAVELSTQFARWPLALLHRERD